MNMQPEVLGELATQVDPANAVAVHVESRANAARPKYLGMAVTMPPETPLLTGPRTSVADCPAASYVPQVDITLITSRTCSLASARTPVCGLVERLARQDLLDVIAARGRGRWGTVQASTSIPSGRTRPWPTQLTR